MGVSITTIQFEKRLPLLSEIRAAFFRQTGLHIYLTATLNVLPLTTKFSKISLLLNQDAAAVCALHKEREIFAQGNPKQYETQAQLRDETEEKLSVLNHITEIRLFIPGFYDIEFTAENNILTITSPLNHYYGIVSLIIVLIDLGGKIINGEGVNGNYSDKQTRLKRWDVYKWYNRPRK